MNGVSNYNCCEFFSAHFMVLILDGSSAYVANVRIKQKKNIDDCALDVNQCLKQIKLPVSVHKCAPNFLATI